MNTLCNGAAAKIIGLSPSNPSATLAWLESELRHGSLQEVMTRFVDAQDEYLLVDAICVDRVDNEAIYGHIPYVAVDHECDRPVKMCVEFKLDASTRRAFRQH